jgi:hypothetical protein
MDEYVAEKVKWVYNNYYTNSKKLFKIFSRALLSYNKLPKKILFHR